MIVKNRSLHLIILPTEKCNFRCTYCYEDFLNGRMQPIVVEGIKKLILRRTQSNTLEYLYLDWFGGEPLVAKKIIKDVGSFAVDLQKQGKLKALAGTLTTNGYLLDLDTLKELVALKHSNYQISLDGFGKDHDETRKRADGRGTFDVIWENLLNASRWLAGEFIITLRLHVTTESYRNIPVLCEEIGRAFGGDKRFRVFFKRISNLGGPNRDRIRSVGVEDATDVVGRAEQHLERAGVLYSNAVSSAYESQVAVKNITVTPRASECESLLERVRTAPYICYACKPDSFVIRATGRLAKCTVAFSDPKNDIGFIDGDGRLHINSAKVSYWTRGLLSGKHDELGCPAAGTLPSSGKVL